MKGGMNLEQFKTQLDTDAQQRCIAQEETIRNLIKKANENKEYIEKLEGQKAALQRRCHALSGMALCIFCEMKHDCAGLKLK